MATEFSHEIANFGAEGTCLGDNIDLASGRDNVSRRDFIKGIIERFVFV